MCDSKVFRIYIEIYIHKFISFLYKALLKWLRGPIYVVFALDVCSLAVNTRYSLSQWRPLVLIQIITGIPVFRLMTIGWGHRSQSVIWPTTICLILIAEYIKQKTSFSDNISPLCPKVCTVSFSFTLSCAQLKVNENTRYTSVKYRPKLIVMDYSIFITSAKRRYVFGSCLFVYVFVCLSRRKQDCMKPLLELWLGPRTNALYFGIFFHRFVSRAEEKSIKFWWWSWLRSGSIAQSL